MHDNYGVTVLDNGSFAIFNCEDCVQTWEEAVENLKWLTSTVNENED